MEAFISNEVLDGIKAARQKAERKKNRLRVHVGEDVYPVVKYWRTGFSVDLDTVPKLRGLVDLYDGGRHLSQCLIICDVRIKFEKLTPVPGFLRENF